MPAFEEIPNSVCAPVGFRAAGVPAGIKPSGDPDVALLVSDAPATAAGVFTTNQVVAAPVLVSREHLRGGRARAIVVNAGNANACTGDQGIADARRMAAVAAGTLDLSPEEVLVASTGVIGQRLPMDRVEAGIRAAALELSDEAAPAARAIMTTDTRPKEVAVEVRLNGSRVRIGGIAKGVGMIGPRMATLLAFLTTDAAVTPDILQATLNAAVERSFNCITVDGDMSTNDSVLLLANGRSGVPLGPGTAALAGFEEALLHVCTRLAKELARDGEGATKLVEIEVSGARTPSEARVVAMTIGNSLLVKTALFGNDPNWGRILAAAGRSGIDIDPARVRLEVAGFRLMAEGNPLPFDREAASHALAAAEVRVCLHLGQGRASATVWTCDLSYDYVRINAEYTT